MRKPTVSIVTVVLNAERSIERCIRSVDRQVSKDWEHIIWDGGSTDDTLCIASLFNNVRRKIFQERDAGIFDAMNKAASRCEGKWIYFLNADDFIADADVVCEFCELDASRSADFVYGQVIAVTKERDVWELRHGGCEARELRAGRMPPHQGFFCRTSLFWQVGGFNAALRLKGDYDFVCRILLNPVTEGARWDRPVAYFEMGGVSSAFNFGIASEIERIKSIRANFGGAASIWQIPSSVLRVLHQGVRVVLKKTMLLSLWRRAKLNYPIRNAYQSPDRIGWYNQT
jgi:glycosyltransferase involved in cell wall biosynthesis